MDEQTQNDFKAPTNQQNTNSKSCKYCGASIDAACVICTKVRQTN